MSGFRRALLYPASDRREQELDEFCLTQVNKLDYIAQSHTRYSEWTADMCRSYDLKPIVLVRSLLDVIVSLRDHLRKQSHVWPMFFAEPPHAELDDERLELMIARLAAPWYINFYMSWRKAPGAMMVSYEEMIRDPVRLTYDILDFAGAGAPMDEVEAAVEHVRSAQRSRLNVGVTRRGANLKPETIRVVLELLDYYPEAAKDPYVVALKAQARAALGEAESQPWPSKVDLTVHVRPAAQRLNDIRRWLRKKAKRVIIGRVGPVVLMILACAYWICPRDLIPDTQPFGYVDDGVVALLAGFLSGRMVYKDAQQRLRRGR